MSENDLVRRGDVLTALERHRSGDMPACDWNEIDGIQAAESLIRDLPADRVAQAAVRLADVKSKPSNIIGTSHDGHDIYHGFECSTCGHKWYPDGPVQWPRTENHHEACPAGIYCAAVAQSASGETK